MNEREASTNASKGWIALTIVGLCSLVFHGFYYDAGLKNLIDLGVMAVDSERILYGQVFSHDYIAPYGPGRYYLIAGLFALFGASMSVLCGLLLALRVCIDVCAFHLAKRHLPMIPSLCVLLSVASAHGPAHKGFLTLWLLLLIWAAHRMLEKPGGRRAFSFGIVVGIAGTFRYDLGVAGAIMAGLTLLLARANAKLSGKTEFPDKTETLVKPEPPIKTAPKDKAGLNVKPGPTAWGALAAGIILAGLPMILLLLTGDPAHWLTTELSRANLLKEAQALPPGIWEGLSTWKQPAASLLSLLLLVAAPLCLLTASVQAWRARASEERKRACMWIITAVAGLLLLTQYGIEPKINRLLQVGPPLFLCLYFVAHGLGRTVIRGPYLAGLFCLLTLGASTWYVLAESGKGSMDSPMVLKQRQARVEGERGGFSTTPALAEGIKASLTALENMKGSFYAAPTVPLLYFLAGRENPVRITDFSYMLRNEEMERRVIEDLDNNDVRCYLYRPGIIQGFVPEMESPRFFTSLRTRFNAHQPLAAGFSIYR